MMGKNQSNAGDLAGRLFVAGCPAAGDDYPRILFPSRAADGSELARLDELPSRDDLLRHLDTEFDREVLEEAFARVQIRVEPRTWEAFRLTALEGVSGAEAARQLGTSVANVFKAKSNLLKLLGEEVRRLEGTEPPQ